MLLQVRNFTWKTTAGLFVVITLRRSVCISRCIMLYVLYLQQYKARVLFVTQGFLFPSIIESGKTGKSLFFFLSFHCAVWPTKCTNDVYRLINNARHTKKLFPAIVVTGGREGNNGTACYVSMEEKYILSHCFQKDPGLDFEPTTIQQRVELTHI